MLRDTLTAALAIFTISAGAAGGECVELRVLGKSDFDLSTGATMQRRSPSVAYNFRDRDFMVVWFDTRNPGNNDIFGQRVALDGSPIGENVAIMEFASAQIDPAIVYESTFGGYLAAWRTQQAGFFNKARGRLLTTTGMPDGDDFFIGEGFEIALANNAKTPEYFQAGRGNGIRGQRVGLDGNLEGGSITIATSGAPAPNGDIVYNDDGDRFFVTWRDQVDRNLKGRRFTSSGAPFGATFTISELFPESGRASVIAYDRQNARYLVAFGVFQESRILGQFVTTAGTLDGDAFTIADGLTSRPTPVIAYTFGEFVLGWVDGGNVILKVVLDDGTVCDDELMVATGTAAFGMDIAAANNEGTLLVTWEDNRNLGEGQQDIYARVVGFAGPCPGDVDESGAVDFDDLLRVLSQWGPYDPCPPFKAEDIDDDCAVDFDDLLVVLSAWGACP